MNGAEKWGSCRTRAAWVASASALAAWAAFAVVCWRSSAPCKRRRPGGRRCFARRRLGRQIQGLSWCGSRCGTGSREVDWSQVRQGRRLSTGSPPMFQISKLEHLEHSAHIRGMCAYLCVCASGGHTSYMGDVFQVFQLGSRHAPCDRLERYRLISPAIRPALGHARQRLQALKPCRCGGGDD